MEDYLKVLCTPPSKCDDKLSPDDKDIVWYVYICTYVYARPLQILMITLVKHEMIWGKEFDTHN